MVERDDRRAGLMHICDVCGQERVLPPDVVCADCQRAGEHVADNLGTRVERIDTNGLGRLSDADVRAQVDARTALYRYLQDVWLDYKRLGLTPEPQLRSLGELIDAAGTLMTTASQEQLGREVGTRTQMPPLAEYIAPADR